MNYRSMRECVDDLDRAGHLLRIKEEIDPRLEAAEIQRRVFQANGPALYFANVKGCGFPMVSNLFGTRERVHFLFRKTLRAMERIVRLKVDPMACLRTPWEYPLAAYTALTMLPRRAWRAPVMECETSISQLPQLKSWPDDGGAFITLPQVYTENPAAPGVFKSNLGMYRVQLSGGRYEPDREIGLHYQIHRGIGVHHAAAIRRGEALKANIFVGGPPAMTLAAVMPLPEGLPEFLFAGGLGGRRVPLVHRRGQLPIVANADFCIVGSIDPERRLPEGPFGDHLGYYSLAHDFPALRVENVYHRRDAIWLFTVVGRPPQEDTFFGEIIHEITGPVIPTVIPGVQAVNAVDAAGVHPLLLAVGSERYVPYEKTTRPQELLTQANAILGQGQMSLAKYLFIVCKDDDPELDVNDIPAFFAHCLRRVDWTRDLHFQTRTTIDTLDYSGDGLNQGSKVVIAAAGPQRRELPKQVPAELNLPEGFHAPHVCLPGILAVQAPAYQGDGERENHAAERFCNAFTPEAAINCFPLIVLVDDSEFTARTLNNFLWVTFTRSNPAADIFGVGAFIERKHWGCHGALVIDARLKPHHAPPLVEDPEVTKRVDQLAAPGGPLHGVV